METGTGAESTLGNQAAGGETKKAFRRNDLGLAGLACDQRSTRSHEVDSVPDVIPRGRTHSRLEAIAMDTAAELFSRDFSHWAIRLPPEDVAHRRRGRIDQEGWTIWYLFGGDDRGEYVDYYATHRMTDDRHVRIYASGEREELPTIQSFRPCSDDPVEDQRLADELFAKNQQVAALLESKGFGLDGSEPVSVLINRIVRVNPDMGA